MKNINQNLHITLFIPSLEGGGAERVFTELANGLSLRFSRVDLVVIRGGGHYQQFVSERVRLIDLGKFRTLTSLFSVIRYLQSNNPDIVLSTLTNANLIMLFASFFVRNRPIIVFREPIHMTEHLASMSGLKIKLIKILANLLYPLADAIICVSKGVANDLQNNKKLKIPIKVIYNPAPSKEEISHGGAICERFMKSKQKGYVFLALGRLAIQKDYPTLINAFVKVRKQVVSTLWIFGEGEERSRLEALVRKLKIEDDVFMPGFIKDPYPYLRAADIFVMSSKYEGAPNSLLQAMACGCKIVSTDAKSGPAEFLEYGKQGYLVRVGDSEQLANYMLRSLDETLNLCSRQISMRRFDSSYIIDEYSQFLCDVFIKRKY